MTDNERQGVVAELAARHPVFAVSTVERWVEAEERQYAQARVSSFVPVLVSRAVNAMLSDLGDVQRTSATLHPAGI